MKISLWFSLILLGLSVLGCQSGEAEQVKSLKAVAGQSGTTDFKGNLKGAEALLEQFLDPMVDKVALSKKLRPNTKDFQAVFVPSAAKKAELGYQLPWEEGKIVIHGNPGQTKLLIWSATSEELKKGTGDAKAFPGGYGQAAPFFKNGIVFYRFKFVKPGETLGFAWDGLVYVNGHWVIFPKPWRVLRTSPKRE